MANAGRKRKWSKKDQALLDAESKAAEQYFCERVKFTGEVKHIDDGKTDMVISLPYPDFIRFMRDYGIRRIAKFHGGQ